MSKRTNQVIMSNEARVLRQMRLKKGLSMRAAGALIGRSDSYISQIENGRLPIPKPPMLHRILVAYGDGIKQKSFSERARNLVHQRTLEDDICDLVSRMSPSQKKMLLSVSKGILSSEDC